MHASALLLAVLAGALPPPPGRVVFPARLGEVVFQHDRHLSRRETCRACHGAGPIGKVPLGKDAAHALCNGCHKEKGGPTACSACHAIHRGDEGGAAR